MKNILIYLVLILLVGQSVNAQKPSAEILAQINKLKTVGSVLYIAAHQTDRT